MSFRPEPKSAGNRNASTAVLLTNLGTPDAPTADAVRRYLAEFLSDPRVIELPKALWWPILHGIILRTRPARSAAKYKTVWTDSGSPLLEWTQTQAKMLAGYLGERGHSIDVRVAMRYGKPSIASALDALKAAGATRVLVLPLYPQYCAATSASTVDAVAAWAQRVRNLPELRFVNGYHDDAGYIAALAQSVTAHWHIEGRGEMLVLSFHGMPARTRQLGDPYHDQCLATARLLAERLALRDSEYSVTFQSRFGRAKWLQPYTVPRLEQLAADGVKRVDVMCPGFAADCLETLEEIDQEARAAYLRCGGTSFHYIPCLNDRHEGIAALTALLIRHLQGWPTATAR
jgi:protoporphyrin/coproporphyrin ferrochelatase